MDEINVEPVWSDSMSAKSLCVKIESYDTSIIVDPAAAVMQKSFPMKTERKYALLDEARNQIEKNSKEVEHVFISHYHYDHHITKEEDFRGKTGDIWKAAEWIQGEVLTYREYLEGETPLVEELN